MITSCIFSWLVVTALSASASGISPRASADPLASCPGYKASNVKTSFSTLTADLSLAGKACNIYGDDLKSLTLTVEYQTGRAYSPLLPRIPSKLIQARR